MALVVHHSLDRRDLGVLPLEPAGSACARELGRRARLRRHRHDRAAVDCATLRGRTIVEVLASLIDAQTGKSGHDLVKDYWSRAHGGKVAGWTITDSQGRPYPTFDAFWKRSLHDGFVTSRGPRAEDRGPESVPQTSIVRHPGPRTSTLGPRPAASRSSSGRIRRSGTDDSRTTAGCRSCPSR